jgi:hypothetical protein
MKPAANSARPTYHQSHESCITLENLKTSDSVLIVQMVVLQLVLKVKEEEEVDVAKESTL